MAHLAQRAFSASHPSALQCGGQRVVRASPAIVAAANRRERFSRRHQLTGRQLFLCGSSSTTSAVVVLLLSTGCGCGGVPAAAAVSVGYIVNSCLHLFHTLKQLACGMNACSALLSLCGCVAVACIAVTAATGNNNDKGSSSSDDTEGGPSTSGRSSTGIPAVCE